MFAYCNNNPVNFIDRNGTAAISFSNGDRNPLFIGHIGLGGGAGGGSGGYIDDEIIAPYINGDKNIKDIPVIDNIDAGNQIISGIKSVRTAIKTLLIPGITPIKGAIVVFQATKAVIEIAWGITDLLIPAEEEPFR